MGGISACVAVCCAEYDLNTRDWMSRAASTSRVERTLSTSEAVRTVRPCAGGEGRFVMLLAVCRVQQVLRGDGDEDGLSVHYRLRQYRAR